MIVVVLFDMTGPYSHRCLREPLRAAVQCADRTSHYGAVTTANQTPSLVRMRRQYVTLRRRNYSQFGPKCAPTQILKSDWSILKCSNLIGPKCAPTLIL